MSQILQLALSNESPGPEEHKTAIGSGIEPLLGFERGSKCQILGSLMNEISKFIPLFQGSQAGITAHTDNTRVTVQVEHCVISFCCNEIFSTKTFPDYPYIFGNMGFESDSSTYTQQ